MVSSEKYSVCITSCNYLLIPVLTIYLIFFTIPNYYSNYLLFSSELNTQPILQIKNNNEFSLEQTAISSPTNLSHLVFGLIGSERAWHQRKAYTESWWRPNITRGFLYLDKPPTGELLPWSDDSPPYRVSADLTDFLEETKAHAPVMIRMVHGIMEVFREVEQENFRWLVMGDDDSIFFVDNMVDVLAQYDHTKYYYLGGQSEFINSNFWFSFNQGFGGAGFILSYPLAKALADDMENCLRRYSQLKSADHITSVCIADIGVNLSPQKGIHQIDLRGDLSGFLSYHPKSPLLSLHHFDSVNPIFPSMDRYESTRHLMKAAKVDQPRMLQQTICYHRQKNFTFSISWGYSTHIYEKILPRSYLQKPIETFTIWGGRRRDPPRYMFDTRYSTNDPSDPSVFSFEEVKVTASDEIVTKYRRVKPGQKSSAGFISEIQVFSPTAKRKEMDRCECCDIVGIDGSVAKIKYRECMLNEIIA